ncbi:hypothetical protein UA08_00953 [Talaromyces atroroseus]|uniref:Acid phosphatase n=1 Tax=Talaromyces atroroseus TaxID=1441469 RepID=A0A225BC50_TALAT|nr:hypothetical protein UA08_00953 [Talaromyces atroroseus]OKL63627.1 hypothetical protein UA08_00953 [Talaromyces atroroseus]
MTKNTIMAVINIESTKALVLLLRSRSTPLTASMESVVDKEARENRRRTSTGVPLFIIQDEYRVERAQDLMEFVEILGKRGRRNVVPFPRFTYGRKAGILPASFQHRERAKQQVVMTSITFREPYSEEELKSLYPPHLKLQLVQVEKELPSPLVSRIQAGELTDKGRQTTFELGQRLRHLYVEQLGFMPKIKSDAEDMYLRASPIPRALESMQQAFMGMYPASARTADFATPAIVTRALADETIYPNDANCRRFRQLSRLFADRAAKRWNTTDDMEYLNKIYSRWMPESSPRVAVDSHPRLSGIMDTINATLAHGSATKLPPQFYDKKALEIIDKIAVEEWFAGYKENVEYRRLGIGGLMGDVVDRMVSTALEGGWRSEVSSSSVTGNKVPIKFSMGGCHDTTLASVLTSLGAYDNGKWPFFTSSIAIELFSTNDGAQSTAPEKASNDSAQSSSGLFSFLGKSRTASSVQQQPSPSSPLARVPLSEFDESRRESLRKYYVRLRFNDRPVKIPGCVSKTANHLPGDDSFCTLEAFKEIVDKFTPQRWQSECLQNLNEGIFGKDDKDKSAAGY